MLSEARMGLVCGMAAAGMACAPLARGDGAAAAGRSTSLIASDGRAIGTVVIASDGAMVVRVAAGALPTGLHGMHIHDTGLCAAPKFTSAGAHLNPTGKQHGRNNPLGAHVGDLANIDIGASGGKARIAPVGAALTDGDGSALVIHAMPDDDKTDPSGNSGDRVACAVVAGER